MRGISASKPAQQALLNYLQTSQHEGNCAAAKLYCLHIPVMLNSMPNEAVVAVSTLS